MHKVTHPINIIALLSGSPLIKMAPAMLCFWCTAAGSPPPPPPPSPPPPSPSRIYWFTLQISLK